MGKLTIVTAAVVAAALYGSTAADSAEVMHVRPAKLPTAKDGGIFDGCYKNTTDRGCGTVITACAPGLEKSGLLCYPPCKAGFSGDGPVCWEECPAPEVDTGAFCNARIFGGDNSACKWYDKCGLTFDKGCVKCPAGYEVHGCMCYGGHTHAKKSYGRGAGVPLGCAPPKVEDAALCYKPCAAMQNGVGPVCWGKCPADHPYSCGAMCLADSSACVDKVKDVAFDLINLTGDLAMCSGGAAPGCNKTAIKDAMLQLASEFVMFTCPW